MNEVECKSRGLKWVVEKAIPTNALDKLNLFFDSSNFDTHWAEFEGIIIPCRFNYPEYYEKMDAMDKINEKSEE